MRTTADRKQANCYILLCTFIYFVSYITRINYGAIISEMVTSTGLSKSALAAALTGSFITYGTGQLISGYFGDKVQPRILVASGLLVSIVMNGVIPVCTNTVQMTAVWCVNGLAQAFMWPPLVKLMATLLSEEDYNRGCVRVSWGSSFGTMFVYLVSPLMIALAGWKSVFIMSALFGVVGLLLWCRACPNIEMMVPPAPESKAAGKASLISPLLLIVMGAIVLQGTLRDGVTTWMPSYIAETFHFSNEIAILVGMVLPAFSIVCHQATGSLYKMKLKNPFLCAAVIFGTGAVAAFLLYILSGRSAVGAVVFSAILTGCMHGVNLLLICMLPPFFAKAGHVSTISGLMNACTYIGSAISAYVIPLATENSGWSVTLLLWLLLAAVGMLLCTLCVSAWKKLS